VDSPSAGAILLLATLAPVLCLLAARRAGRRRLHGPTVARLAFVVAVVTWLGYAAILGEFHRVRVEVAAAAGAGALGLLLLWVRPAEAAPRRGRRLAHVLAFDLCLLALLAEVGLRIVARVAPTTLLARSASGVEERLASLAFSPGENHFGFPCNSRGFYDEEFLPRERRARPAVAVIGDSYSASTVPHFFHYTTVCERALGDVDLLNLGWGGIGPDEYLRLLEREASPLAPEAILVALFLGNDLVEVRPWTGIDWLLAGWFDRGNVLLLELPRRLRVLSRETSETAVFRAVPGRASALEEVRAEFPWVDDVALEPGTFSGEEFLRVATRYAATFGSIAERRWNALAARVLDLRERAGPTPFGVILIPDVSMIEDALWERIVAASPDVALDRHALRERLVALCAAQGIPCLDLWPALRAVPPGPDGDRHLYLRRDLHWNVRGNEVAGRALAPFVRALF